MCILLRRVAATFTLHTIRFVFLSTVKIYYHCFTKSQEQFTGGISLPFTVSSALLPKCCLRKHCIVSSRISCDTLSHKHLAPANHKTCW